MIVLCCKFDSRSYLGIISWEDKLNLLNIKCNRGEVSVDIFFFCSKMGYGIFVLFFLVVIGFLFFLEDNVLFLF